MGAHKLTAEQRAEAVERYRAGEKLAVVAEAYGVSEAAIYQAARKAGAVRPTRTWWDPAATAAKARQKAEAQAARQAKARKREKAAADKAAAAAALPRAPNAPDLPAETRRETMQRRHQMALQTFVPIATSRPVRLVGCNGCRWPVNAASGSDMLFCNAPRPLGDVYCDTHAKISRRPMPERPL
ncbi:hypothetical protein NPA31_011765 [Aurantimonas sp. MSK8Z-1]|uniref:GcrA family cell cycle regulator n=1 Tax=Mangrovibrevibacter kandeliae TaxID=2968473 RepID=UPI0021199964|nr:GcrA family cell cycle regulator [Aurantimonas sp. MSK8Z-1]MCW4115640.1 hypothetical protein [Aurantimonas sp. MSK8Z-1]